MEHLLFVKDIGVLTIGVTLDLHLPEMGKRVGVESRVCVALTKVSITLILEADMIL